MPIPGEQSEPHPRERVARRAQGFDYQMQMLGDQSGRERKSPDAASR